MPSAGAESAAALRQRLFAGTLPLWRRHGVDPGRGFHERLDLSLRPVAGLGKRTLVQARQIYVFSHAALLGQMEGAGAVATAGLDFLLAQCRHPDGGWRHRVTADGAALDDARHLYDQAFVAFALAWHHRATGDPRALPAAAATLDFIDAALAHPSGGWREGLDAAGAPLPGPRRQNPHMHLLEASLALYEATGDARHLDRAAALADLLRRRFLVEGSLREYLTEDLRPAPGDAGRQVEPGHHFEWVWLLHEQARLTREAVPAAADALYRFALAHGLDAGSGGPLDLVDAGGQALQRSRRIWPQTEAIKAHAARALAGDRDAPARLHAQCAALLRDHFDGLPPGRWHEHLDAAGAPRVDYLPGTTLYHLTLAAAEAGRVG